MKIKWSIMCHCTHSLGPVYSQKCSGHSDYNTIRTKKTHSDWVVSSYNTIATLWNSNELFAAHLKQNSLSVPYFIPWALQLFAWGSFGIALFEQYIADNSVLILPSLQWHRVCKWRFHIFRLKWQRLFKISSG